MSILNLSARPTVRFDVSNAQHRQYVQDFMKTRSWAKCPVVFHVDSEYSSVVEMVSEQMMRFYMSKDADIKMKRVYKKRSLQEVK